MPNATDKILLRKSDDWQALYRNGWKIAEGQRLSVEDVLDALGVDFDREFFDDLEAQVEGAFPDQVGTIDDIGQLVLFPDTTIESCRKAAS